MRAVIYARLSRRTDSNVPNLADQLDRCREYAVARGWQIVAEASDFDSAFDRDSIEDRTGFAEVVALVRAREVDAVLAWRPDRLWRDPIEAAVFMRACTVGRVSTIATVLEGERDPTNPSDEMTTTIVAAVARYEVAAKRARLLAKHRQLALAGRPNGGQRPFGFQADRVTIDEAEAAVIREAAQFVLAGGSVRAAVGIFNEYSPVGVNGSPWTTTVVKRILTAPRTAGLRRHGDPKRVVGRAAWDPILDEDTWLRLCAVLDDPSRRTNGRPYREYLLTGLLRCGLCDAKLVARPRSAIDQRCYVCASGPGFHGCGKIRRVADPVEAEVVARMFAVVDELDPNDPGPSTTAADLRAVEETLRDLARDHYVHGLITRDEFFAAREGLEARAAAVRAELAAPRPDLGSLQERWPAMPLAERRKILRDVIDRIVIHPAVKGRNTFDPTKVEIVWRS